MGLDIYLIKIVKEQQSKYDWLTEEENPELKANYSEFITTRTTELENGEPSLEKGYYTVNISYQRKGVKPIFFKKFKADDFIFTFDKLLELRNCIMKEHQNSFESDFMQKFKERENFIMISY